MVMLVAIFIGGFSTLVDKWNSSPDCQVLWEPSRQDFQIDSLGIRLDVSTVGGTSDVFDLAFFNFYV
jgi:hypothetical protein